MEKCGVFNAASLAGRKWTIAILQELELNSGNGYNSIFKRMGKISPKVLSQRLRELESMGLVEKKILRSNPLKTSYSLTEKGEGFQSIVKSIKLWNTRHSNEKNGCGNRKCVDCELY